jgi:hypothetical protein
MSTIDNKEIFNYLGIPDEGIESIDSFRERFESEFVKKSVLKDTKSNEYKEFAPTFVGKVTGSTQTTLNRKLKEYGIELDANEIKDKRIEDVIEMGVSKLYDSISERVVDLEGKLSKGKDEATKELETKYNSISKKYSELEQLHNGLKNEYQSAEEKWKNNLKNERVNHLVAKQHEGIKWKAGIKDIEREGFFGRIKSNYKIDYDENSNQLEVFDVNGNRIPNPKKSGTWKTYAEILEEEGLKNEVWSSNEHANKMNQNNSFINKIQTQQPTNNVAANNNDGRFRKISNRVR